MVEFEKEQETGFKFEEYHPSAPPKPRRKGLSRQWRRRRAVALLALFVVTPYWLARSRDREDAPPPLPAIKTEHPNVHEPNSVMEGRDGWLFYRQGVDYVTGPPFLDKDSLLSARNNQRFGDPRTAILNFAQQLRARGIKLIMLPVPDKVTIYPEKLWEGPRANIQGPQNASYGRFIKELIMNGVDVYDPTGALLRAKTKTQDLLFSATDTHWTPRAIQICGAGLAKAVKKTVTLNRLPRPKYTAELLGVSAPRDLVDMGRDTLTGKNYAFPTLPVRLVRLPHGEIVTPSKRSDVLILGDSCAGSYRVYGGDLAAQLAYELRRPVDSVTKSNGGSWGARYELRDLMANGEDHLAGKKVVIWEFVARDLAFGDWMPCQLPLTKGGRRT